MASSRIGPRLLTRGSALIGEFVQSRISLTEGSIPRALLAFSLPILCGNVLQSVNGSVNAVWVGKYLGEAAFAAVGNCNVVTFQPLVGSVEQENLIYLAHGAEHVGDPEDINEAEQVAWVPLASVPDRIARGEIVGAGSMIGLLRVLADRAVGQSAR